MPENLLHLTHESRTPTWQTLHLKFMPFESPFHPARTRFHNSTEITEQRKNNKALGHKNNLDAWFTETNDYK